MKDEETIELLTSPLQRALVGRIFIIGGPIGLAVAIVLSLWVSYLHVRHSAIVQVDDAWVPSERLAIRAQIVAEQPGPVEGATGEVWVEQAGERIELASLESVGKDGVLQGSFTVPELSAGEASLGVRLAALGVEPIEESLPLAVGPDRKPRDPVHVVSGSTLNYGDDSDPQPPGLRIVVRPHGRVLTGFVNTLYVRLTRLDGTPYEGPVIMNLLHGEFMEKRGQPTEPPRLVATTSDRLGLVELRGPLTSEVLRIEVQVPSREDATKILHRRRVRMVSYAGAVTVGVPSAVRVGSELEIDGFGLSSKRPVFVDIHGPDGAYVDTLNPPFLGREEPRPWTLPSDVEGVVAFEAYHFTNAPGESAAVALAQVHPDPSDPSSLIPLIEKSRKLLELPRVEAGFDRKLEESYLDWLAKSQPSVDELGSARSFLLGTMPVQVYGPPPALNTRQRELDTLAAKQRRWTIMLRIFLLGGGGLFLGAMTFTMVRAHAAAARATASELAKLTDGDERVAAQQAVSDARRGALLRGLGVIGVMAAGLVLTTIMLESFLWVF